MISLIKSGIMCLVSMFLYEIGFIRKTRCNRNYIPRYLNQLVQPSQRKESNMLQCVCSLTKPNVIEKYAVPIQNNQYKHWYKAAFQQRRKCVWCIFFYMATCCEQENKSKLYVFSKVQEWSVVLSRHIPTADKMLNLVIGAPYFLNQRLGILTNLTILKVQKFEQFPLFMY